MHQYPRISHLRLQPSAKMEVRVAFVHTWCPNSVATRHLAPLSSESWRRQRGGSPTLTRPSTTRVRSFRLCAQTEEKSVRESTQQESKPLYKSIERSVTFVAYVGFAVFVFFLAPGSFAEPGEFQKILAGNFDQVNDLFFAIYNLVGIICLNYGAVLNAGASRQKKLPLPLFTFLGVLIGFLAFGPYLIGRELAPKVDREEVEKRGLLGRILESRIFGVGLLLYALWIYAFSFGLFTPGSEQLHDAMFYAAGVDFSRLFLSDRVVCTTTVDVVLMSVLLWGPLTEDMRRRRWFTKGQETESWLTALSILSAPGLGPALYLVLRPRLPGGSASDSKN